MDWLAVLIVLVIGLVLSLALYLNHLQQDELAASGGRARGAVVRHQVRLSRVATVTECVIRFATAQGRIIEAVPSHGVTTIIPAYSVGEKVTVAYNKADPTDFTVL